MEVLSQDVEVLGQDVEVSGYTMWQFPQNIYKGSFETEVSKLPYCLCKQSINFHSHGDFL